MKFKYQILGVTLVAALLLATGCSAPQNPVWAGLSIIGDDQNVLIVNHERIVRLDVTNGQPVPLYNSEGQKRTDANGNPRLWDVSMPDAATMAYAPLVKASDKEYLVTTYSQKIFRLDMQNAWLNDNLSNPPGVDLPGHVVAQPLVNGDWVYVPFSDTGNGIAAYKLPDLLKGSGKVEPVWVSKLDHGIWGQPLLINDVLYYGSLNHNLYAHDAKSDRIIWSTSLEGSITSSPAVKDDKLYVGTLGRKVFQVSAKDGTILSQYTTNDWVWATPALADDKLYIADVSGWLYALQISGDGFKELWKRQVASKGIRATPLVEGDTLIVASRDHHVYWLNTSDGSLKKDPVGNDFVRQLDGEVLADLVVIRPTDKLKIPKSLLLVSTMNNAQMLVAFTLDSGEKLWQYGR